MERRPHVAIRFAATVAGAGLAIAAATAGQAWAWGHTGHLDISAVAAMTLPIEVPAFVRTAPSVTEISQLGAEPDVSKGAGFIHDRERDPGHYVDIDDSGNILGITPLSPLAATREAYDTALRAGGQTQYFAGYLPYNLVDGWQQVRKDFALWRAFSVGEVSGATQEDRNYFRHQRELREKLTRRDIGVWSHFVGDASQPLHVSVHYNGWGNYPNPQNFTTAPIHAPFEGAFVANYVKRADVLAAVGEYHDCACAIELRVVQYLQATLAQLVPLYTLATASPFTTPQPAEVAFATERLAAGAAELRDQIVDAWRSSDTITVGYPPVAVTDIESGKVILTKTTLASD